MSINSVAYGRLQVYRDRLRGSLPGMTQAEYVALLRVIWDVEVFEIHIDDAFLLRRRFYRRCRLRMTEGIAGGSTRLWLSRSRTRLPIDLHAAFFRLRYSMNWRLLPVIKGCINGH